MNKPEKNPLEWTVFAISALLVLAAVAVLVRAATEREPSPPDLRIELGEPQRSGAVHRVPVRVRNEGGRTAAEVRVEVVLTLGGGERERAELLLAFVPAQSEREGWVVFRRDPSCCEMIARPMGFEAP